jgi:hypothetical protein
MRNLIQRDYGAMAMKKLALLMIGFVTLSIAGCKAPDASDGVPFEEIELPTDTLLNLACEDVGINQELCVLDDPENPFVHVPIIEFDINNPDAANKFDLFNGIPAGPTGAKARFYFWATALTSRNSGENQFYTALALHELWDLNSDPIIQAQALKAYKSVLDNFFGSVTVFTCCPGASPSGEPVPFPVGLNQLTADNLYRTDATGFSRLVPGDPLLVLSVLLDWGYTYLPANPPNYNDGVVGIIVF